MKEKEKEEEDEQEKDEEGKGQGVGEGREGDEIRKRGKRNEVHSAKTRQQNL